MLPLEPVRGLKIFSPADINLYGRQPDSVNPTVRDENGGLAETWVMVEIGTRRTSIPTRMSPRFFAVGLNDWLHDFFYLAFASQAKLDLLSIQLFSIAALITVVYSAFWTVVNCTHFFFCPITYLTDCSPTKVAISFEIAVSGNVSLPFFLHYQISFFM